MAIPKIIHYCWLSDDPVPQELQRYMATWKKHMPDYEYVKWDFSRFDKNSSVWVREAFENKKYAFAADYIRLYALYTMGGIYMDMDVEVLKPFDDLLKYPYFICWENHESTKVVEMATFGAEKGADWVKCILDHYINLHFIKSDGSFDTHVIPGIAKEELKSHGYMIEDISYPNEITGGGNFLNILPHDYFSPKSYDTGKNHITKETYSIHQFSSSWIPWEQRLERKLWIALGLRPHRIMWHIDKWMERFWHKVR